MACSHTNKCLCTYKCIVLKVFVGGQDTRKLLLGCIYTCKKPKTGTEGEPRVMMEEDKGQISTRRCCKDRRQWRSLRQVSLQNLRSPARGCPCLCCTHHVCAGRSHPCRAQVLRAGEETMTAPAGSRTIGGSWGAKGDGCAEQSLGWGHRGPQHCGAVSGGDTGDRSTY